MKKTNIYSEKSIQVLENIEAVRKRPAMYLGSTDEDGFHHLVWEIIDNALDEYLAGYCRQIQVTLEKDNVIVIEDNGRGIPIDIHSKTQVSTIETVFTYLHAGGKFDSQTYMVSGGLHGVGSTVVNAMSEYLKVIVYVKDKMYQLHFIHGIKTTPNLIVSPNPYPKKKHGTRIEFKPDLNQFDDYYQFRKERIEERLQQTAYINSGVKIIFTDQRIDYQKKFFYKEGVLQFLDKIVGNPKNVLNQHQKIISGNSEVKEVKLNFACRYTNIREPKFYSFCNNIRTVDGGAHEQGFKLAFGRTIKKIMKKYHYYDEGKEKLETNDAISGLRLILVILHPDPRFAGQTKTKLVNSDITGLVSTFVGDLFERFLLENPQERDKICKRVLQAMHLRIEIDKKIMETQVKNSFLESSTLPGKLADCASKEASETEIFIVEGDSAGGSAKLARDRHFQAVLSLKGKIINSEKMPLNKLFANQEINDLISSLGFVLKNYHSECLKHQVSDCLECKSSFDEQKLRYHKVIIMTDADVDGAHISVLLLTFLYRYLPGIIKNGYVYLAKPPLYKFKVGKRAVYLYSEQELKKHIKKTSSHYEIQRYKGLGEMNPGQLWETTMDPQRRFLIKVNAERDDLADAIIQLLMGKEVEGRKKFILENAQFVQNLDI